jgi:hypothetical protein
MSGVANTTRLRGLIQAAKDAGRWTTYDDLAKKTGLPKSTVHQLARATDRADTLPREMLDALASGLGLPVRDVLDAHLADMGLVAIRDEEQLPETVIIAEAMREMTEDQRRRYVAMALQLSEEFRRR